ncbi:hypothetical protein M758_7G097400 [Ceratodon purpureus]|nr:hypothetical protein M758_7G097400 [Ceratodon purpureus]
MLFFCIINFSCFITISISDTSHTPPIISLCTVPKIDSKTFHDGTKSENLDTFLRQSLYMLKQKWITSMMTFVPYDPL